MPRDLVYVNWCFDTGEESKSVELVRHCGLEGEPCFWRGAPNTHGSVRLRRDDPRLRVLIRELIARGEQPHPRFDREYTPRELASAEFLRLVVATAGLEGSANFPSQHWDRSRACRMCGAGSIPIEPLRIRTSKMGRKLIDATSHDNRLIVPVGVASKLVELGLRGFVPRTVCKPAGGVEERWKWLDIEYEWPGVDRGEFLYCAEPCTVCRRAGHYNDWSRPIAFVYDDLPDGASDFGVSHEYFSRWYDRTPGDRPDGVAGGRVPIISQSARQVLLEIGVRHVKFEPVFRSDDPLLKTWPNGRLLEELSS